MGKRKVTYQVKEKAKVTMVLTGVVYLQYVDDEESMLASKGDMLVYANNEALHTTKQGQYQDTGFTGYFKVDVSDGKNWQPLLLNDIFAENENHFAKTERPIDTFNLCLDMLKKLTGATIERTYREHYQLAE